MAKQDDYNILFGAGELFIVPEDIDMETATEDEIEEALELVGESNGEASLIIENEFAKVRGGRGHNVLASFQTEENISFNAGIVTFELDKLSQFLPGEYNEVTGELEEPDKKVFKLGGNYTIPIKRLRFVHYKKQDGKRLILDLHKAQNESGLEMNFNAEEATAFELEFSLQKAADKDNIVTITEEI